MKKIVLMAAFMVASLAASAQVYVGGSLGFESQKADKDADASSTFSIMPELGYNLSDNLAVGIQLGYTHSNDKGYINDGELSGVKSEAKIGAFEVAPYARYTFAKTGIASFFVDGGIKATFLSNDAEGTIFGIGVRPGVKLSASEKVDFIAKLGYIGYQTANEDAQGYGYKKECLGLNIDNTNLEIGVLFNF